MVKATNAGMTVRHELPAGRVTFGVTRMSYRVRTGTVVGPVQFEPSMARVRFGNGVERVFLEHLTIAGE